MSLEEFTPQEQKELKLTQSMLFKSPEEINCMCDSGMFNSVIEGYCRIIFEDLEISDKLKGYSFASLFDMVSAEQARKKACI